jgi:polyphenol oxidase
MWLKAPNISSIHGFSTRLGGFSSGAFDSLNLGGSEDNKEKISRNRQLALKALKLQHHKLITLKQIHSNRVCLASEGFQEGDALVTNKPGIALAVSVADCYPILFEDSKNKIIAAVHAGWRGTVGGIVKNTLEKMFELGAEPSQIRAAIGQGISLKRFEVGDEVIKQFRDAGFDDAYFENKHIDLAACNKKWMLDLGVNENNIWHLNRCTFEEDFFSYRRDKGKTGRMWGVICIPY